MRTAQVEGLLAEHFEQPPEGRWLVVGSASLCARLGLKERWTRLCTEGGTPSAEPPEGPFDGIVARLQRGTEVTRMVLHLLAGRLLPSGKLVAAAANDEGGRSLPGRLEEIFDEVGPPVPGRHARRVEAARPRPTRASLEDWRTTVLIEGQPFASWPGLFAHGRLDAGTELLLSALPDPGGATVLDVGCGIGVLGAWAVRRGARAVHLVDHDALAVHAARRNVPEASVWCADTLPEGDERYDLVVSNPPIHQGSEVDWSVLERLGSGLPARLRPGAEVWLVTQVTLPIRRLFAGHFLSVEKVREAGGFAIWKLAGAGTPSAPVRPA